MSDLLLNRDLSLLEFNRRVLAQAQDPDVPLLERVKFLGIFCSNMDEFFMKRMVRIRKQFFGASGTLSPESKHIRHTFEKILSTIQGLNHEAHACYKQMLLPKLIESGIQITTWAKLKQKEKKTFRDYFKSDIFPLLTPLAVDPAHPFPFLSNLSRSLGISILDPAKPNHPLFARVKIPENLPQWLHLEPDPEGPRILLISILDVIEHHLPELFPEMQIQKALTFRVTRNIDVALDEVEEVEDLVETVEEELRLRRLAELVRLEIEPHADPWITNLLLSELGLKPSDLFETTRDLNAKMLHELASINAPHLKYKPYSSQASRKFSDNSVELFQNLREQDFLLHHPFESFSASVLKFVTAAVHDPNVMAIKMTLYRTGEDSPLIPLLIEAAELGKQVVCVLELKARFDEERNLRWAEKLEEAGVHVIYGVVGLKIHCKLCLIVRKEGRNFQFYSHIGTGNYNAQTSRLYTDVSLFTADNAVNSELLQIFNYLTGLSLKRDYQYFLVAPINLRRRLLELIDHERANAEQGKPARIIAKMNNLDDPQIADALYSASKAGVGIDLIVRSICTLKPGVKHLSSTIRVKSVVGRFLEHSRIFYFQNGQADPKQGLFYLGSADWMTRNLDYRVETLVPIVSSNTRSTCFELLQAYLADHKQSWILNEEGKSELEVPSSSSSETAGIHEFFMNLYPQTVRNPNA